MLKRPLVHSVALPCFACRACFAVLCFTTAPLSRKEGAMGGKTWSLQEETLFWRVVVPRSPKAVRAADRVNDWETCVSIMQRGMGQEARRVYTPVMLCMMAGLCSGSPPRSLPLTPLPASRALFSKRCHGARLAVCEEVCPGAPRRKRFDPRRDAYFLAGANCEGQCREARATFPVCRVQRHGSFNGSGNADQLPCRECADSTA